MTKDLPSGRQSEQVLLQDKTQQEVENVLSDHIKHFFFFFTSLLLCSNLFGDLEICLPGGTPFCLNSAASAAKKTNKNKYFLLIYASQHRDVLKVPRADRGCCFFLELYIHICFVIRKIFLYTNKSQNR